MVLAGFAVLVGLVVLVWSADRFVDGAAATARVFGMPSLLIGMVVVGFGTSAPEMAVSALSALQGNPGMALGNAYGSNTANIALIIGLTAIITPIVVQSRILRKELPILLAVTALAAAQLWDGELSRADAWTLLGVFGLIMGWTIYMGVKNRTDPLADEMAQEMESHSMPLKNALIWLLVGLVLLLVSSRLLVWGAVEIAHGFGVSDLIIGLTIVAVGTSLPELASSIAAARKGEDDIALGNVIGSNFFNTLAVVGIAGAISPMNVAPEVFSRDIAVMSALTVALLGLSFGFRGVGKIGRGKGVALLVSYAAYTAYLAISAF